MPAAQIGCTTDQRWLLEARSEQRLTQFATHTATHLLAVITPTFITKCAAANEWQLHSTITWMIKANFEKDFEMNTYTALSAAVASVLTLVALPVKAIQIDSRDKPFDEYSWITTHNSYEKINQNLHEMPQQLKNGVRGFMLDLYPDTSASALKDGIKVCHKVPVLGQVCYGSLYNQLNNEFAPFLRNNPTEVVTLFLESYVERDQLQAVLDAMPELANYSFNPANFPAARWPTLKEMAAKNNRLIMMSDQRKLAGNYTVSGKTVTVLFDQNWIVQNKWDTLGAAASNIEKAHNWSCPTRWGNLPLNTARVSAATGKQWKPLFMMNQFHHATSTTLDSAAYDNNLTYLQRRGDNCGVMPNFVGVNNYASGEVDRYTNALNNGGIYFYEDLNANKAQDAVCVVPTRNGTVDFKANGCENDEAKSLTLSGVAKGTRISLFDNANGSTQDDHLIIDVKRDIGIKERVLLPNFEANYNNNDFKAVYQRNNGLNGKMSRITIGKTPTDFSDASIAFYESTNATQNLDCVVPFSSVYNLKMKSNGYGCSNDEIQSAKIVKAKAGTSFTLTGQPDGNFNEGRTQVQVLRDLTYPVIIPSFNSSYSNADVKVTNYTKGVNGKISFGYINGAK
jgi:hypothetical protein